MARSKPQCWIDAHDPEHQSVQLLAEQLALLGFDAFTEPDRLDCADNRSLALCRLSINAPGPNPEVELPWIVLGDLKTKPSHITPMAQLPWPCDLQTLQAILDRIWANRKVEMLAEENKGLIGSSEPVKQIRHEVAQVAPTDATVLILGETGTGKEVIARMLHLLSNRADKPFVPVNCGAIPGELLESELFGHEKGAFTGAINQRKGRFELAEGGTIFLDEIGDMPLSMQVKILRVLQERRFERVGGTQSFKADVRIVAATHRNLLEMVERGDFREDLYYRLNVFPIYTRPLREIRADIPAIAQALSERLSREGRPAPRLSDEVLTALRQYHWPGNVRELSNVLERLGILAPDRPAEIRDLPPNLRMQTESVNPPKGHPAVPK
ncbi:MAG TPA: sigma-54-dependent Fis family transcriptional regulator, partial [Halothiobacillaceae bacterium]|nr:sigma-54-dependent Fis family transcriptional regulator [Halothiobacillaceae bacterium]